MKNGILLIGIGMCEDLLIEKILGKYPNHQIILSKRNITKRNNKNYGSQIKILKLDLEKPQKDLEKITGELKKTHILIDKVIFGARSKEKEITIKEYSSSVEIFAALQIGAFSLVEILYHLDRSNCLAEKNQIICLNGNFAFDPNPSKFLLSIAKINLNGIVKMLRIDNFNIGQVFICGKIGVETGEISIKSITNSILNLMENNEKDIFLTINR